MAQHYAFEQLHFDREQAAQALEHLLKNQHLGEVWLLSIEEKIMGYMAITFCFSLEFGGKNASIDEFFILEQYRRRGYGAQALKLISQRAIKHNIQVIHLEVNKDNKAAINLYKKYQFEARKQLILMSRIL